MEFTIFVAERNHKIDVCISQECLSLKYSRNHSEVLQYLNWGNGCYEWGKYTIFVVERNYKIIICVSQENLSLKYSRNLSKEYILLHKD